MKTTFTLQSSCVFTILSHFHMMDISDPEAEIPVLIPSSLGRRALVWPSTEISQINQNAQCPVVPGPTSASRIDIVRTQNKDQNCRAHHGLYLCLITSIVSNCLHQVGSLWIGI